MKCVYGDCHQLVCAIVFFFFGHTIPQLVFITVAKIRNSLLKSSNVDTLDINHKVVSLYMYITVFEVNPVSFKLSI